MGDVIWYCLCGAFVLVNAWQLGNIMGWRQGWNEAAELYRPALNRAWDAAGRALSSPTNRNEAEGQKAVPED